MSTPIVLTPIGLSAGGGTWQFDMSPGQLSDGTSPTMYESHFINPGESDVVVPSWGVPDPGEHGYAGINLGATTTPGTWCEGMKPGAEFWFEFYGVNTGPRLTGSYFYAQYDSVKADRANWVASNRLIAPNPIPGATKTPGAKKK